MSRMGCRLTSATPPQRSQLSALCSCSILSLLNDPIANAAQTSGIRSDKWDPCRQPNLFKSETADIMQIFG